MAYACSSAAGSLMTGRRLSAKSQVVPVVNQWPACSLQARSCLRSQHQAATCRHSILRVSICSLRTGSSLSQSHVSTGSSSSSGHASGGTAEAAFGACSMFTKCRAQSKTVAAVAFCKLSGSSSRASLVSASKTASGSSRQKTALAASKTTSGSSSRKPSSSRAGSKGLPGNGNGHDGDDDEKDKSFATLAARWTAEVVASPLFYLVAGLVAVQLVSRTGESPASILVFAALPITLLTALSKSSVGKKVQEELEARLPQLQADAEELRGQYEQSRQRSPLYGDDRPRLPGSWGSAPHLTGQVAGDYGFDPLGLAREPAALARNYEAELLHARWAMLGAVGALVPEALTIFGGVQLGEPVWWKVGASKLGGDITINWGGVEGFRIAGKQGLAVIAGCQLVLMGGPEYARQVGIRSLEPVGVFLPGEQNYPGGTPFDPLGLSRDPDAFITQAVNEINVGRLAMLAMLGYDVQAAVTGKGPVQNLLDFLDHPAGANIATNLADLGSGWARVREALPPLLRSG